QPELLFRLIAESSFSDTQDGFPQSFRCTDHLPSNHQGQNYQGLDRLNAAGCSQFDKSTLLNIIKTAPSRSIIVVSLRKEPYAFAMGDAQGMPISWFGTHNDLNKGLTPQEALDVENRFIVGMNQELTSGLNVI